MAAGAGQPHVVTSYYFFCLDGTAVDVCASVIVGTDRGAFEGFSRKYPAGTRVAEDLGAHPSVGIGGSVTSFGSAGNGSIGAQLHLAAEDGVHAAAIHDQEDQVGGFSANLEAHAATFQRVHRWGSPGSTEVFASPTNHGTATVVRADSKREFLDGGNHDDAFGFFQKIVGNVEHFLHDNATLFEALLFLI